MTKSQLISQLKKSIEQLKQSKLPMDSQVIGIVDEGGYLEGFRLLSFFDLDIKDNLEDDMLAITIEVGFED